MLRSLLDIVGDSKYYEYPSFEVAIYSLILAFVLSGTIAFTYRITFRGEVFPNHFFQAMVLSSLVSGMIMMAVGNNFAVGFGIIGAVAIIRFRTLIQDPRNIIFIFASISIGIATGVYGYAIAIAGTAIFCTISILLYFSPFGHLPKEKLAITVFSFDGRPDIDNSLGKYCESFVLKTIRRNTDGRYRSEFMVVPRDHVTKVSLFEALNAIEHLAEVRIEQVPVNPNRL